LASVPEAVKTTSGGRAPISAATCSRAPSTASRAACPKRWMEEGLPCRSPSQGSMASRTRGWSGVVPVEDVIAALRPGTRAVALMLANNELGTLQPVAEVETISIDVRVAVRDLEDGQRVRGVYAVRGKKPKGKERKEQGGKR